MALYIGIVLFIVACFLASLSVSEWLTKGREKALNTSETDKSRPLHPLPDPGIQPAMRRYYFHIYNDVVTMDDEGAEFVDDRAARAHAVQEARVLAADTVLHGHFAGSDRIEIVDQHQQPVGHVRFDEAVDIRP